MGEKIKKTLIIYRQNLTSTTNTIKLSSVLKKDHLESSCQEFSSGIVSICEIDGKHKYSDQFTK